MADEKLMFKAEVSRLLDMVAHSLYSNKEIFLRELISNASDACDRLRYAALTEPALLGGDSDFAIRITPDKAGRTLTVSDNGIGMNRDELVENLGTIARSGTAAFMERLSGDAQKDVSLIGQFGVGFYSAFMVADQVDVFSRRAGEETGWRWSSSGKGEFEVGAAEDVARGTRIVLHLKEGEDEFLDPFRLETIVKTYSDHIALPVILVEDGKERSVNTASALWTRPKTEVTPEQHKEFYRHIAHAFDEPWLTLHYRAEGAIEYNVLLYIPSAKPFDLFAPERKQHVKLYVKRVFITDDCDELLPSYLRFVQGVVDSQDLPLNISREMLQHNPMLAKIRSGLVKRILAELKKKAEEAPQDYLAFWDQFGAVLKEGLYEDFQNRDELLDLCRFRSTRSDEPISLAAYVERMKEGQTAIYTIAGDDPELLLKSPHLEGFAAKGVEVLLLTDPIDEFWPTAVTGFKDKPFRSVAQGAADLAAVKATEEKAEAEQEPPLAEDETSRLIAALKQILGTEVKDVRPSERLRESAVCLVADDGDVSLHLERLLRAHRQAEKSASRILEINPRHPVIRHLAAAAAGGADAISDSAWLLLDQARIVEGEPIADPQAFARRLSALMSRV
ncbi:MAG: molecular chaperone HtpG [Rhodospirillaceae bacterium]|nr:molecular chaperone HtpG [Rhodospirillaceae bacterium]